ncbi:hypothetical protein GE09DRAFT_167628 [Coniochaeta sp. 2T2.1]|nr:hypothetical protein GE09DRAFT_167628 [Coniochaeta sp. 2T2.1]
MAGFANSAAAAGLPLSSSSPSSSIIQQSRNAAAEVESVMGRRPSATPSHLSRILYVPRHTSLTTHLPLYDVSEQYARADVGSALIGSSLFTIRLGLMKPPREDGTDGDVQYLVDFQEGGDGMVGKVQQRVLGNAGSEVDLLLGGGGAGAGGGGGGGSEEEGTAFTVKIVASNNPFRNRIPVRMSFPIPDSITKSGISQNPYFAFVLPGGGGRTYQWEIHPVEHGPLRYTLVSVGGADGRQKTEEAMYHHVGLGASLSTMQYSEGILLLPPCRDSALEGVVVASLLGLLWRVRAMGDNGRRTSETGRRNSLFGKMLRKRSTG